MEEISLRELIEILLRQKKIIIGFTLITVVLTAIVSFVVLDPIYETKMVLMASQFSEKLQSTQLNGEGVDNLLNVISQYPTMTLETYRQQITAPRVMRETIQELGLEEEFDVESLAKEIVLETINNTNLITIKMKHKDPEKAALIVNKVGERFMNFVSEKAKEAATTSSAYVKEQMEVEKNNLDKVLQEQKEFLSQPRGVLELSQELDGRLLQITEYKKNLTDLEIRQDSLQAAIEVAEQESSDSNRVLLKDYNGSGEMQLMIESTATLLKIELAEVQSNIRSIGEKITLLQKEIEGLQVDLQEKKHQERLIEQKVSMAQKTYDAFYKKYEELRITESSKIGEATITVISKAFPTTQPVAPRKLVNVAIATVLGLMLGVFVAFLKEYWIATGKDKNRTMISVG